MPTRSRASARTANAPVEESLEPEETQEPQESSSRLKFDEALSWRAGKPIALADLLRRLQALSVELRDLEQDEDGRDSFTRVAKELAASNLLSHKDKGVRAWTACCLVDILRLCAPDAPFTAQQLKDIFRLFITSIVPALSDPSHAYNTQHVYVIQSLAQVKSIVLLTDLPSSDELILHLFASCFDILSGSTQTSTGEQIGKHVEHHLTEILVILVDEASSLPAEVVDIIVAQFLRADPTSTTGTSAKSKKHASSILVDEKQSTLVLKDLPPAYNMAKTVCNSCPEKMARYVSQYFNDVIMDASSSAIGGGMSKGPRRSTISRDDWDDDEDPEGPSDEDLKELSKAHKLLRELWRASPAVLQNVIPQLETELSAENVQLRLLATETLGDIVSGIGAAGPPPQNSMDPAAYPQATLSSLPDSFSTSNVLTTPASPQSFSQAHPAAYNSLLSRRIDKSPIIRAAWATGIGRILMTSAGGAGLNQQEEKDLVTNLAEKLVDADERVRIAAIKVVATFGFRDVVVKLGSPIDNQTSGTVLSNLADRVKDKKHGVRTDAMKTLGRLWGVAAGEIAAENETVTSVLSFIPSRIFDAFYVNDPDINVLIDHVTNEFLLPLSYPPIKARDSKGDHASQKNGHSSQTNGDLDSSTIDPDAIRAQRSLLLAKGMDERAKKAFYAMLARQAQWAKVLEAFIKRCEDFNAGVMDENEVAIKASLNKIIDWFSQHLSDPLRVSSDLWKFAKIHSRRSYTLIRFCMNPETDYRTVIKAIRELKSKPFEHSPAILETLMPIIYRSSLLIYNKSHVPAIVEISRSDEHGLGATAHEFLKEISTRNPEVFKAHVKALCRSLEDRAPTAKKSNELGAIDTLKACAGFARKFPKELPQEKKFLQSLMSFAQYGSPPRAAKHAVTILMAASERKESNAKELLQKSLKGFKFGENHFLTRLATLSQLTLLAPVESNEEADAILDLVLKEIIMKVRTPASETDKEWTETDVNDEECEAKLWALKILVNRLRAIQEPAEAKEIASPVYQLLYTLILKEGELSTKGDTPTPQKSRLRLAAARLLLKLSTNRNYETMLSATYFNHLAYVAQDSNLNVRQGFINTLKKYLGQNKLPPRFYNIVFLLGFEPAISFRESTTTWIRSRANALTAQKSTIMESNFARLLSLLAHHPDYSDSDKDLSDFARYILFYLQPIAREENLGLIYHVAQRVKQTSDALDPKKSNNLYHLSDLAQALIRRWEEANGWSMQTWPGKLRLPASLFATLPSHQIAQEIATKTYLPDGMEENLDALVKAAVRSKTRKRKSEAHPEDSILKKRSKTPTTSKPKSLPYRKLAKPKTPKSKRTSDPIPSSERRTSSRVAHTGRVYAELSDEEDDADMEKWDERDEEEDEDEDREGSDGEEQEGEGQDVEDAAEEDGMEIEESPKTKAKSNGKSKTKTRAVSTRKGRSAGKAQEKDLSNDDA